MHPIIDIRCFRLCDRANMTVEDEEREQEREGEGEKERKEDIEEVRDGRNEEEENVEGDEERRGSKKVEREEESVNAEWAEEWRSGYFGIDKEVREKRGEKFLSEHKEREVRDFLAEVLGEERVRERVGEGKGGVKELLSGLQDGVLLCQLSNALVPGLGNFSHFFFLFWSPNLIL